MFSAWGRSVSSIWCDITSARDATAASSGAGACTGTKNGLLWSSAPAAVPARKGFAAAVVGETCVAAAARKGFAAVAVGETCVAAAARKGFEGAAAAGADEGLVGLWP